MFSDNLFSLCNTEEIEIDHNMFLLVLIDADTYRGYSSCVSFRCTKVLGDEMYLKCPAPVNVHNDADPLSLNSKDIFEEIGYRASQHWVPETDKPYICSNCGKGYTHIFTLNRHRRTVCGKRRNNGGKWKCTRCKRSYATKGNLDRHIQYACGVKRKFCCFVCHSMFTQRCSLIRHLKTFHDSNNDD